MTRILSTAAVSPGQTTEYWVDALCDAYVKLECDPQPLAPGQRFYGEIRQNQLSTVDVSVVNASAQRVSRTRSLISRSSDDVFIVSIQAGGRSRITQADRSADLDPGDFAIYDSTRPYTLLYPENLHQITLKVPRQPLLARVPSVESLTALKVSGQRGAGRLMVNLIDTLLTGIDDIDPVSHDAVAAGIVDILAAGLRTLEKNSTPVPSSLHAYHLQRIKAYVREHLHESTLSAQSVAAALHMSVSSLYRAFEREEATLSDWIWSQRLDRCRRDLADPMLVNQSVTQIGFRWGFSDASHLSRAFRRAYGAAPREFRMRSLAPEPPR